MRHLRFLFLFLTVVACHPAGKSDSTSNSTTQTPLPEVLSDKNIYTIDSVKAALRISGVAGALQAKKIFLRAVDLCQNQKNAAASIELFRKSIRIWPDAKSYYELGNALIDAKDYKQSLDAYSIASALQYAPGYMCSYNKACAFSLLKDTATAVEWLENAVKEGYSDKKELLDDPDLNSIRGTDKYREILLNRFTGKLSTEQLQFLSFLLTFPEMDDTLNMTKEHVADYSLEKNLSYDFADYIPGMEDSRFSRSVSNEYQVVGKKQLKNGIMLVAYSNIEVMGDTLPPVTTYLQTYDSTGKQIDNHVLACFCDPTKIVEGTLEPNQVITMTEYKQVWKFDPINEGYANNSVVQQIKLNTEYVQLTDAGRFIPAKAPLPVTARKE